MPKINRRSSRPAFITRSLFLDRFEDRAICYINNPLNLIVFLFSEFITRMVYVERRKDS